MLEKEMNVSHLFAFALGFLTDKLRLFPLFVGIVIGITVHMLIKGDSEWARKLQQYSHIDVLLDKMK